MAKRRAIGTALISGRSRRVPRSGATRERRRCIGGSTCTRTASPRLDVPRHTTGRRVLSLPCQPLPCHLVRGQRVGALEGGPAFAVLEPAIEPLDRPSPRT